MSGPQGSQRARFPARRSDFPSPYALWVFAVTARHENFTKAGADIGLSQGAVSYQIKELETSLGFSVFDRIGKKVQLNAHGRRLYPVVRGCFADIAEAIDAIRGETRKRAATLTISATSFFASRWLSPRLAGFMAGNTGVSVQVIHEAAGTDASEIANIDIRFGRGAWADTEALLLFETPMTVLCCPKLLAENRDRSGANILDGLMFLSDEHTQEAWQIWRKKYFDGTPPDALDGPLIFDSEVRTRAGIDGQGFIISNQLVNDDIKAGRLVVPFEQDLNGWGYYVVVQDQEPRGRIVQAFVDWLFLEAKQNTPTKIARNSAI